MSLAFYSAQAAEMFGTSIYRDKNGEEVHVTALVSDPDHYKWQDKVLIGEIDSKDYVRQGSEGYWSTYDEAFDQMFDLHYTEDDLDFDYGEDEDYDLEEAYEKDYEI